MVYAGDSPNARIRLVANGSIEIHPLIKKPAPVAPVEFDIPREATRNGELLIDLESRAGARRKWARVPGVGNMADQEMNWQSPVKDWRSPVKEKLRAREVVTACTITTNSVDIAAHAATLGFDFLWIEMEHSPITLETLRNMVLATRGLPALPFARVPVNEIWTAKRVLDAGVFGVIFPFTSTPELARQAVAACRYPPHGRRGSGATLARFRWPDAQRYSDSADENITVIGIIEEVSGGG